MRAAAGCGLAAARSIAHSAWRVDMALKSPSVAFKSRSVSRNKVKPALTAI